MSDDDDDVPQLPADTLAILNQFLLEKQNTDENVSEDWQLSQFWYDDETTNILAHNVKHLANMSDKVALISCPTLMQPLLDKGVDVTLFEFDDRFKKFGNFFVHYDYRQPLMVDDRFHKAFNLIVADPPFLAAECLTKTMVTVRLLQQTTDSKVILCTGAVMEDLANQLASFKPSNFQPRHKNNLANEFRCFTNFGELPVLKNT